MKALSLTQPWASMIAYGGKLIETRNWDTKFRGWLVIHAANGQTADDRALMDFEPYKSVLAHHGITSGNAVHDVVPRGAAHAVARLIDIVRTDNLRMDQVLTSHGRSWNLTAQELCLGDYSPDRYAWLLADVTRLTMPRRMKGRQKLWNPTDQELHLVEADLLGRKIPGEYHSAATWTKLPDDWNQ